MNFLSNVYSTVVRDLLLLVPATNLNEKIIPNGCCYKYKNSTYFNLKNLESAAVWYIETIMLLFLYIGIYPNELDIHYPVYKDNKITVHLSYL